MSCRSSLGSFLCVSGALMLAACGGTRDPGEERIARARKGRGDVTIAAAWPWELRKEIRYAEGLEMAVEEVNAGGGVAGRRLRLVKYDDRESIDEGRVVAQKIAQDPEVVAVIGHLQSYVTMQATRVYEQAGLVLVAPTATAPDLTEQGFKHVFRATFTDESVGRQLAEFGAARGFRKVAIYYIRNTYGRNVANAFEMRAAQAGIAITARESYDPSEQANARTFERVLQQWKPVELDAILLAGEVPSAAIFVAQARAAGINVPILGGDAMSSPALMTVAGAAAEGMIVASFFHRDEPRPEIARFVAGFEKRYGAAPDAGSALGYDCVRVIAAAMNAAGSVVPDDVAKALHALKGFPGVTASFTFDEHGEMLGRAIVLSVVRGGAFVYLPPAAPPAGASKVSSPLAAATP
jgi:branched-chain amino acid transport system substrate-binding protein